jgi:hypothetical protein
MQHLRNALRLTIVALAAAVAACSDAPSSPSPSPALSPAPVRLSKSKGGAGETEKVGRANPLTDTVTVSYKIDPKKNGSFELPGTGLRIDVPAGAVETPITITASAIPGAIIAYQFQPHGLVFKRPLQARQDLRVLAPSILAQLQNVVSSILSGNLATSQLEIAYYANPSALDAGSTVSVQEFLASNLDFGSGRVEFSIEHFSGYMVAWGRR